MEYMPHEAPLTKEHYAGELHDRHELHMARDQGTSPLPYTHFTHESPKEAHEWIRDHKEFVEDREEEKHPKFKSLPGGTFPEHALHRGVVFETHEGHHPGFEVEPKEPKQDHEHSKSPGAHDRYYADMHIISEPIEHIWHHTVGQTHHEDHHTEPHYLGYKVH